MKYVWLIINGMLSILICLFLFIIYAGLFVGPRAFLQVRPVDAARGYRATELIPATGTVKAIWEEDKQILPIDRDCEEVKKLGKMVRKLSETQQKMLRTALYDAYGVGIARLEFGNSRLTWDVIYEKQAVPLREAVNHKLAADIFRWQRPPFPYIEDQMVGVAATVRPLVPTYMTLVPKYFENPSNKLHGNILSTMVHEVTHILGAVTYNTGRAMDYHGTNMLVEFPAIVNEKLVELEAGRRAVETVLTMQLMGSGSNVMQPAGLWPLVGNLAAIEAGTEVHKPYVGVSFRLSPFIDKCYSIALKNNYFVPSKAEEALRIYPIMFEAWPELVEQLKE